MSGALAPVLTCDGAGCCAQVFGATHQSIGALRQDALRRRSWSSARRQSGRRYRLVDLCPSCGAKVGGVQPPGQRLHYVSIERAVRRPRRRVA